MDIPDHLECEQYEGNCNGVFWYVVKLENGSWTGGFFLGCRKEEQDFDTPEAAIVWLANTFASDTFASEDTHGPNPTAWLEEGESE